MHPSRDPDSTVPHGTIATLHSSVSGRSRTARRSTDTASGPMSRGMCFSPYMSSMSLYIDMGMDEHHTEYSIE